MTVIWTTNHGSQEVRRTGLARIKSSDWQCPVAEDSSMPPGNSAQLGRQSNCNRNEFGPKSRIEDSARTGQCGRWIYRRINDLATCESEVTKSADYRRSVLRGEGHPNLRLRRSIRNRAHGHLGDDSFCDRCWDNRDAHAGIDERDEGRHLSGRLDHLRDDSSVAQNSSQKIMESRSVLPRIHDKWIPFEFAQTNLFLGGERMP